MPGYTSAVGKAKPSPCSLFETRPNIFVTTGDFIILHHLQTACPEGDLSSKQLLLLTCFSFAIGTKL
ncbi:hypothetical protein EK904_008355 [Melospiza melodia maxima]|nr:hypothetical protein EK904_008355 [Melospiza melodia maxima]